MGRICILEERREAMCLVWVVKLVGVYCLRYPTVLVGAESDTRKSLQGGVVTVGMEQ